MRGRKAFAVIERAGRPARFACVVCGRLTRPELRAQPCAVDVLEEVHDCEESCGDVALEQDAWEAKVNAQLATEDGADIPF